VLTVDRENAYSVLGTIKRTLEQRRGIIYIALDLKFAATSSTAMSGQLFTFSKWYNSVHDVANNRDVVFLRTRRRSARHRIKKREKRPKAEYNAEAKGEENTPPNAAQHAAAPNQATLILSYTHAYKPTKISTHLRPNVGRPALRCTGG
jgi:hypothetical protein